MIEPNSILHGDCLELMPLLNDHSIDMILCDLPYGTTACKWDTIIPFEPLWKEYKRLIKDNGAIVLTASQPFTSSLVMSNPNMFKYSWIYKKKCASNFAQAKYAPMKEHEDILIFSRGKVNYYPIKEERQGGGKSRAKYVYTDKSRHACGDFVGNIKGEYDNCNDSGNDELRYPSSVQEFNNRASGDRGYHPTQKPVALFEYLIKTYTKGGEIVLDNCSGSGTTGVACINTGRNYILMEKEDKYYLTSKERIKKFLIPDNVQECTL
jgi:site-specific DNA-methyltransferase (adenine-specific)